MGKTIFIQSDPTTNLNNDTSEARNASHWLFAINKFVAFAYKLDFPDSENVMMHEVFPLSTPERRWWFTLCLGSLYCCCVYVSSCWWEINRARSCNNNIECCHRADNCQLESSLESFNAHQRALPTRRVAHEKHQTMSQRALHPTTKHGWIFFNVWLDDGDPLWFKIV